MRLIAVRITNPLKLNVARPLHPNTLLRVRTDSCPPTLDGLGDRPRNGAEVFALAVGVVGSYVPALAVGVAEHGDATEGHDNEGADRRKTGANDADVDLDSGPDGDFLFDPGGVR